MNKGLKIFLITFLIVILIAVISVTIIKIISNNNDDEKIDSSYNETAVTKMQELNLYDEINNKEYSKTIEVLLEENKLNEKYLNEYYNITYSNINNFSTIINQLLDKSYNSEEINYIISNYINNYDIILSMDYFDILSFKNISNDVAKNALKSVYTGETESLKELGVVMTQAALQEFARTRGIQKKISAMKTAEMVELRYQYVLAKTKTAQGDFLRTGGNAANQMRMYNETLKEIKTNFGMTILPEYTKILTDVNRLLVENMPVIQKTFEDMYSGVKSLCGIFVNLYGILQGIKTHSDLVVAALSGIATVALITNFNNIAWAILGLAMQMGTLTASTWASVTAFAAQTAALLANPMTWIAIGIGAVVAGLVLLAMNWDKVKNAAINFVQVAKDKISELWEKVAPVFNKIAELARKVFQFTPLGITINAVRTVKDKFEGPKPPVGVPDVPGFASGTPNFSGGLALVGEKGPELVSLPPRTQIFSNKNTIDIFKNSAIEKYNNVIKIEDYLTEKTVSFNKEHIKNNNEVREDNVIYLEIELDAPEGYDAKVVNARSSSGKEFKVKLRGKRKQ